MRPLGKRLDSTNGREDDKIVTDERGRGGVRMREFSIGEVIKQRRIELGLTQEELCEGIYEPLFYCNRLVPNIIAVAGCFFNLSIFQNNDAVSVL